MITGLVLQGGALGAFELGVIEWLLDNRISPDVVSGVSIGAINATVLAGSKQADPRDELRDLWADLTTPTFRRRSTARTPSCRCSAIRECTPRASTS